MAETVGQGDQQAIVGNVRKLQRSPHPEIHAATDHHERNVVQSVGVPLSKFVAPDDQRIVQQRTFAAGFRYF